MLGTRGVPACYGGFETAVEEVGRRLVDRGHRVRVYCRGSGTASGSGTGTAGARTYRGMELVTLPAVRRRALETLSHTGLSVAHLLAHRTDVALVFNAANAPLLPVLRAAGIPLATHVDGLEWKRAKWAGAGQRYYRAAEAAAVRWSDALIADAVGIADYYRTEFGVPTTLLSYGAPVLAPQADDAVTALGLVAGGYHLVVARFEPENNVDLLVDGYVRSPARLPLVVVGAAPYAHDYTARVRALVGDDPRVRLIGAVWDQRALDQLYVHALTYAHGHSVGGTNPSLLRAVGAGTATLAYDVSFNREVLGDEGVYVRDAVGVAQAFADAEAAPAATAARGERLRARASRYDWDAVAAGYERLVAALAAHRTPGPAPGARRRHAWSAEAEALPGLAVVP
ncbi:DUF1972 domain-containing protein [Cellulomonas sp. zg-ZUI222]|uniref:DUF1972 domain-containing protein n=1 Tax=Cellulomonas wangleii TaxID=2816956 RepID=A0ABX8DAZ6_9CELL|nr:DUF1972 domain-containing protein [Cellulomonas wangleii]MBO0922197.1 DUF1972 domain-containing protein [Cellulomonas wangleii]MBO0925892.1 DUF1972 domain-containing protein [Cellulomonas wangleii]QVI64090.1 DUF1972 domain-containing protein [Cellulomonas wangleii]